MSSLQVLVASSRDGEGVYRAWAGREGSSARMPSGSKCFRLRDGRQSVLERRRGDDDDVGEARRLPLSRAHRTNSATRAVAASKVRTRSP